MSIKRFIARLALSLCALGFAGSASAQPSAGYPVKPVKLLVSYPPGGFADLLGRGLAQALSQLWGQPVIVDNRPGAAGILATEVAAKSPPDGYTLYLATEGPFVINPYLYKNLSYDPVNDFIPVAMVAQTPFALVVNPDKVAARNVSEFVALARASASRPLDYASGGAGGTHHIIMESFIGAANISLNHVPYKGGAPALQAVLAGEVAVAFSGVSSATPHAKTGKLRILASGGNKRSALSPEVPSFTESGLPGFDPKSWVGIVVPRGTPQPIVEKLGIDLLKVARDPQFAQKLNAVGADALPATGVEFREVINKDQQKYSKLIRDLKIQAD